MMKKKICVEVSMAEQLREFLNMEKSKIEVVTDGASDVAVVKCDGRKESDLDTIFSGGWISCETALALAKKLRVPVRQMGKVLDHLDVKIRKCGLGCFK